MLRDSQFWAKGGEEHKRASYAHDIAPTGVRKAPCFRLDLHNELPTGVEGRGRRVPIPVEDNRVGRVLPWLVWVFLSLPSATCDWKAEWDPAKHEMRIKR